jgi:hypothetical protein
MGTAVPSNLLRLEAEIVISDIKNRQYDCKK